MIVTRRRRKKLPWKRILTPLVAVSILAIALWWTPSRTWLAAGPLTSPVWRAAAPVWIPLSKPFDAIAQAQTIKSENARIAALEQQLAGVRSQNVGHDKQLSALQSELNAAQQEAAMAKAASPAARPRTVAQSTTAIVGAGDLSAQGTPDMRRTAQIWSAMDSEAAGKVVERLPDDYVARVFSLMPPDSVGAILESLPASYAARLTQDHPELKR